MKNSSTQRKSFNFKYTTHKETLLKFLGLAMILIAYFSYITWKFDASTGFGLVLLTWSFFVLCTPVADGGFILAFPIRLLFGIKMLTTQIITWFFAIAINAYMLFFMPNTYQLTFLTRLLERILTEAFPYWSILIISALGTFLSIYFGDELIDVTSHKDREKHHQHGFKYRVVLVVGMSALTTIAYYHLLNNLNITIPK